jgi:rubrerythrin
MESTLNNNSDPNSGMVKNTAQTHSSGVSNVNGSTPQPSPPGDDQSNHQTSASTQDNVVSQSATQPSRADDNFLTEKLYPEDLDSQWNVWKCMTCGYVYEGVKPLNKCPRCGNTDPDKFDDPY